MYAYRTTGKGLVTETCCTQERAEELLKKWGHDKNLGLAIEVRGNNYCYAAYPRSPEEFDRYLRPKNRAVEIRLLKPGEELKMPPHSSQEIISDEKTILDLLSKYDINLSSRTD